MNIYAVLTGLGAALGLWRASRAAPERSREHVINGGLFFLLGCLLGARLAYCLLHSTYFSNHPEEGIQFWQGGLFWPGAALGGSLVILILSRSWRIPLAGLVEEMTPILPPLAIAAWLGCWQTGTAYGPSAPEGAWWGLPCRDESGDLLLRFPLQMAASLLLLLFITVMELITQKWKTKGITGPATILILSVVLLAISLIRADPGLQWAGLNIDTWSSLLLSAASLASLGRIIKNKSIVSEV